MKRFRILCLMGFVGSLVLWMLPTRCKPYHIKRALDDWKILLVEQDSEWGFASGGIVKVRTSIGFGSSQPNRRELLAEVRQDWIRHQERSRLPWPVDSLRIHFDEWGPSRTMLDNGVEVTEVGTVFCMPYSVFAICFALPLVWHLLLGRRFRRVKHPETAAI